MKPRMLLAFPDTPKLVENNESHIIKKKIKSYDLLDPILRFHDRSCVSSPFIKALQGASHSSPMETVHLAID